MDTNKFVIPHIEVFGGLISRLYALSIIRHLCQQADFYWNPSDGINCNFNDVFQNEDIISSNELCKREHNYNLYYYGTPIHEFPAISLNRFSNESTISETTHNDKRLAKALLDLNGYLYIDYPIVELGLTTETKKNIFNKFINELILKESLQRLLHKYISLFFGKKVLGLNIRNCCPKTINFHNTPQWLPSELNSILEQENCDALFISCCNVDFHVEDVISKSTKEVIFIREQEYPIDSGQSVNGVGRAMVEWLLLSMSNVTCISNAGYAIKATIYGSNQKYVK